MTAAQTICLFEIVNAQFGQPEAAQQVVEAFEAVLNEKTAQRTANLKQSAGQDVAALRQETRTALAARADVAQVAARPGKKLAAIEVERLRWVLMMMLVPFYVGMIVFLIKQFV